ncbi:MAG: glycoside hydrolase family 30 protein [Clostridia bacterium]|nr:glycoside hydrolase family 30 protein [Clostridia bacterium]
MNDKVGDLNAGTDTLIDWNILLDEQGGPNHVGNFCDAPMMYDTKNGVLHKKLSLDYIGHFSKAIKPGAVRVGVSCFDKSIEATAARNSDGSIAIVLLNPTESEVSAFLRHDGKCYPFTLPAKGIMTCMEER